MVEIFSGFSLRVFVHNDYLKYRSDEYVKFNDPLFVSKGTFLSLQGYVSSYSLQLC